MVRRRGSEQAGPIDTLFDVMIVLSCFVFAIVMVMFGYAIWKFRVKPGDEADGKPIHGNTKLEIAWTVIPTVIVLFGAAYSWIVLDDIEAKADDPMPLDVTAQQFEWTFEYPEKTVGTGEAAAPVTTHELHVPVDRQLDVHLEALDVLHSFWVPEWRIKRDAGPGRRPGGDEVDDTFVVTPEPGGHLQPRLHRALRASGIRRCGPPSWSSRRRTSTSGSTSRRRRSRARRRADRPRATGHRLTRR